MVSFKVGDLTQLFADVHGDVVADDDALENDSNLVGRKRRLRESQVVKVVVDTQFPAPGLLQKFFFVL